MKRITQILAVALLLFAGNCKKNSGGGDNDYYFTFQNGSVSYSTNMGDSLFNVSKFRTWQVSILEIAHLRNQAETDSAQNGLGKLATWYLYMYNYNVNDTTFIGVYTTDTSSTNTKLLSPTSDFRFYTENDPHKGQYVPVYGLPFTMTISEYTSTYIAGTFEGQMVQIDYNTNTSDTTTISNGKFRIPINP